MKENLISGCRQAVHKISLILLKYLAFEGVFFIFHGQKKYKIRVSVLYIEVFALKN